MQKRKDAFVIYGRQPVAEALKSNYKVEHLWLAQDLQGKLIKQIKHLADNKKVSIRFVPKNDIQKITGPVVHQGIAALTEPLHIGSAIQFAELLHKPGKWFVLVLDQIQDPHNLGAILRSADICGVDAVILSEKGSAQLNTTVAKTSVGALFHLNIFLFNPLEKCFEILAENKVASYGLIPGAATYMYNLDLKKSLALVIGSEGQGVRKNIARLCTGKVSIPQFGKVESLNASVASAVIMYEVVRQRKFK